MSDNEQPKRIEIFGGQLPSEIGQALLGAIEGKRCKSVTKPATLEQAMVLIEAAKQEPFKLGEKVELREWAADRFKFPKAGEHCIVTQVLDQPLRSTEVDSSDAAFRNDIAIAFMVTHEGDCEHEGETRIVEHVYDSRMFQRVSE